MFRLLLTIFVLSQLISCSDEIDKGEFEGFEIGMTKTKTLDVLFSHPNITYVKPDISEYVEVKGPVSDIDMLDKLLLFDGIVLTNSRTKFYMKVGFKDNLVDTIFLAPVNDGDDLGIKEGDLRNEVKRLIYLGLSTKKIQIAFNYLPYANESKIADMSEKDIETLVKYDNWLFNGPGKYSETKLQFNDDKLSRIVHRWNPIELP